MPRSLRIGVLLGDQLVEERVFSTATPITFGQSLKCALSVPVDGAPREHVLFANGVLHPAAGMTGRIGRDGKLVEVGTEPVALERGARGKLAIGDATILFQDIATPPAPLKPRLPASLRGTLADRVDQRLAVIIGGSLVVHIAIAVWAWSTDLDTQVLGEPRATAAFHQETIDVTLPDFAPPTTTPGIATPAAPATQTPRPIVTHVAPPPSRDDALRLASILTDETPSAHGTGEMTHRQPSADLAHQIADARDHRVAIGESDHTSRVDDRARIGTDPERAIAHDDPTFTTTGHTETITARMIPIPPNANEVVTLTPAAVLDKIDNVYMAGLQRCYRKGLVLDATLAGRVAIGFTVDRHGRVAAPTATGVTSQVDACVAEQMAAWHFPMPKDKDGDPTEVDFHVSLALQPS